jgi:hypothetical protein
MKIFKLLLFLSLSTGVFSTFGMLTQKIKNGMSNEDVVRFIKKNGVETEISKNSISDEKIQVYRYEEPLKPFLGITLVKRVYSVPVDSKIYTKQYELQTYYIAWTAIAATLAFHLWSLTKSQEATPLPTSSYESVMPLFCGS